MLMEGSMWGGDEYDFLMGRWSRLMAPLVVQHADVQDGDKVLDIGCGTGSLTRALLDVGSTMQVTGVDGSADFIEICRQSLNDSRVNLDQGDAQSLPYSDNSFDKCLSLLVMNFIPDPGQAVKEMRRVTRAGGTVTAAVWDYGKGMEMLRYLWDEAASMDADAIAKHEGNMPLCRKGELAALWTECGLTAVHETALKIPMKFSSFDDYWTPFLTGIGPSGSYVVGLDASTQTQLKERLCEKLVEGNAATTLDMEARAWAVRGVVPE
jgi:SAM-dependent methyltransferase